MPRVPGCSSSGADPVACRSKPEKGKEDDRRRQELQQLEPVRLQIIRPGAIINRRQPGQELIFSPLLKGIIRKVFRFFR